MAERTASEVADELPPCPFCGEHDGVIVVKNDPGYPHFATLYLVHCNQCAVQTTRFTSRAEAITAWTRRTLPQGYAAGIEAAAKYHDDAVKSIRAAVDAPNFDGSEYKHRSLIPSPDAGVVEKWMGIESAPKDGTPVLIGRDMGEPWGFVRGWGTYENIRGIEGWVARGFSEIPGVLGLGNPTHWQPLPAPPALAALRTIGETALSREDEGDK